MSNRYVLFYSLAAASHYGNMPVLVKKNMSFFSLMTMSHFYDVYRSVLFIDDNESFL